MVGMKRSGKVHWMVLVGLVGILAIAFLLLFSKESASVAAQRFMMALAKGDVETLTKMSSMPGRTEEDIRKQWEFATKEAGPYYRFVWQINRSNDSGPNTSAVVMDVLRNATDAQSYQEKYELPMIKENGVWKVEVSSISRGLYPALPR